MAGITYNAMLIVLFVSGIYAAPTNKSAGQDVKTETELGTWAAIVRHSNNTRPSDAANVSREDTETNPPSKAEEVFRTETVAKAGVTVSPKTGTVSSLLEAIIHKFRAKRPSFTLRPSKTSSVLPQAAQSQNDSVPMEPTSKDGVTASTKTETEAPEDETIVHKLKAKIATMKPATSTSIAQSTTALMTSPSLSTEVQSTIHEGSASPALVDGPETTEMYDDIDEDYEEELRLFRITIGIVEKKLNEANLTLDEGLTFIMENSDDIINVLKELARNETSTCEFLKHLKRNVAYQNSPDYDDDIEETASFGAEEMTGNRTHHLEVEFSSASRLEEPLIVSAMIFFALSSLRFL